MLKNFLEEIDSGYDTYFPMITSIFNSIMFLSSMGNLFLYHPVSKKFKFIMGAVIAIEVSLSTGWILMAVSHDKEPECDFTEFSIEDSDIFAQEEEDDDMSVTDELKNCIDLLRSRYTDWLRLAVIATTVQIAALIGNVFWVVNYTRIRKSAFPKGTSVDTRPQTSTVVSG
ncbi:hypothetical protein RF11_05771 [Thelohanellus kitauei]|uniref:Uncharacterized protein n=1 Tax=Thelohanellus kitauei TaxID=669202 RepID=A0A0C2I6B8_THEKT|nr:hypothetical protein RF11_05771 [Thelohanellus kitauei]